MNKIVVLDKGSNDAIKKHKIPVMNFNPLVFLKRLDFNMIIQALNISGKKKLLMMLFTDIYNLSHEELYTIADNCPRDSNIREFYLNYANLVKRNSPEMREREIEVTEKAIPVTKVIREETEKVSDIKILGEHL